MNERTLGRRGRPLVLMSTLASMLVAGWPGPLAAAQAQPEEIRLVRRWAAQLPEVFQQQVLGVAFWQYLALVALFGAAMILRTIVKALVGRRLRGVAKALGQERAGAFVERSSAPLATLAMAVVLQVIYPFLLLHQSAEQVVRVAVQFIMALAILNAGFRVVDLLSAGLAQRAAKTESKLDDQLIPILRKSLKTLVAVGGVLVILQNLDVDVGSLLAGLGIGGLAFAFAAKETLSNIFGSVMIFVDRPFQIGDWIVVSGAEGIVEEVGFRSTRIRTFYNSLISVPNAIFNDAKVDNYGARRYRRTYTTLNVTYSTSPEQLQAFCQGIRAILLANPYTRKDYYEVHFCGFGPHSLDIMLYFFFEVTSWTEELRERHNVYLEILRLARDLRVEFAFPTQTLNVERLAQPTPSPAPVPPLAPPQLAELVRAFGPKGERSRPTGPQIVKGELTAGSNAAGDSDG